MNNETISLAFNDLDRGGSSDKVYHLSLAPDFEEGDAWSVTAQYGRRGSALISQIKEPGVPYAKAKKTFDKIKREKLAKGYIVEGTAPEPQVTPTGKPTDIKMPELLEEITNGQGPDKYLNDDDYWMQDKSDGVSRGVIKSGGEIFGINKLGKPVPLPAELVAELTLVHLDHFQIDAELVGSKLICRDILVANADISEMPYVFRFARLVEAIQSHFKYISIVTTWAGPIKKTAIEQQRKERKEGVVFKLASAPYRPGRNGQHKKYKFIKTLSAICGEPHYNGKQSVELFLYDEHLTQRVNLDEGTCGPIVEKTTLVRCGTISLIGKPAVKKGDIVEVQYLYAHKSGLMVQARMKCVRHDIELSECTTAQLIYKREENE